MARLQWSIANICRARPPLQASQNTLTTSIQEQEDLEMWLGIAWPDCISHLARLCRFNACAALRKALSTPPHRLSSSKHQSHRMLGSQRPRFIKLIASASCGRAGWQTSHLSPRLSTRQPAEQPTSLHLLTRISTSHPCSPKCNSQCARAKHTQHTRPSSSSASKSQPGRQLRHGVSGR